MTTVELLLQAVINGKSKDAKALTQKALDEGSLPGELVDTALVPAMAAVGEKFKNNEFYVPEMLIAARAMKGAMAVLKPYLKEGDLPDMATVAIGTVQGDLHDIGKNLVGMMLEGAGFKIVDLGVDVSPERYIEAVTSQGASVIALSALLTTTMPNIGRTIEAVKEAGLREKVKVIIGGAPVTQAYCDEIGADGYSPDAGSAVDLLKSLVAA